MAAQNGHLEVVRFLVESGANKDQGTTDDGVTPLYIAAQNGHLEVVRFLVESGANKDQGNGATPLFIAAHRGTLKLDFWFSLVPTPRQTWSNAHCCSRGAP